LRRKGVVIVPHSLGKSLTFSLLDKSLSLHKLQLSANPFGLEFIIRKSDCLGGCSPEDAESQFPEGKEVKGMKKPLKEEVLQQEAAFWAALKEAARENPAQACHK
jgi:hypothetical protein